MKKYLNISEVSNLLDLKEHVIRYWDSVDPKTEKPRIEGISTKSNKGTRYFNRDNIEKLKNLKNLMYENGSQNASLKIASKLLNSKKNSNFIANSSYLSSDKAISKNSLKINQILKKIRLLVNT